MKFSSRALKTSFLRMTFRFEKESGIYMVQELLGLLSCSAETKTAKTLTDETLMLELAWRGYDLSRLRDKCEIKPRQTRQPQKLSGSDKQKVDVFYEVDWFVAGLLRLQS